MSGFRSVIIVADIIQAIRIGCALTPDWSLIKAPAIDAAVRLTLLLDRHPDALGEGVGAFLIALDHALILGSKLDRPSLVRRCDRCLLSSLLCWRDAGHQRNHRNNTCEPYKHRFPSSEVVLKDRLRDSAAQFER